MKCRFEHDASAVAVYILSEGCYCYPDDKIQALCAQHEYKAAPLGEMILVTRFDGKPFDDSLGIEEAEE